jgi:hypothetical protein
MRFMSKQSAKGLALVLFFFVIAIAMVFFLTIREAHKDGSQICGDLTAIAGDAPKMKYVRDWAISRMNDPQFMQAVRQYGRFRADPKKYIDLDWGYLGFTPLSGWMEFNIKLDDWSDADATEVGSVSLHRGRSFIIVGLRANGDLALEWPPAEMSKLKAVGSDVFVYCE